MSEFEHSERVDVGKLDDESIKMISSSVARVLTQAVAQGAKSQARFHIKLSFSNTGGPHHTEVIVGDEPAQPTTPKP